MNLFLKKLFGLLESTEKMEAKDKQLFAELIDYKRIAASDEYAEYKRLFDIVNSPDFKEKKKTLKTRRYKDTEECRNLRAFNKLSNNPEIKLYYQTLESKELKDYEAFKNTEDYYKLSNTDELDKSPKLEKYKNFEGSKEYQNYLRFNGSYPIQEYERLKDIVSSEEFKKNNEFWQDKHRWETTDEYKLEEKLSKIAEGEDCKFFISTNPDKFKRIEDLVVYKKDTFNYKNFKDGPWRAGFYYSNSQMKGDHSLFDEKQANVNGKNTTISDGLTITTKQEKTSAPAWHETKGFVVKDFDFTSDVVSGYDFTAEEYCGIRVKMRCSGKVNHAFWLSSGEKLPHINVALIKGRTIEVGVYDARGDYYYTTVGGINPNDFYIYSIYQKKNRLIWKINNIEVFRTKNIIAERRFFPTFNSFIPNTLKKPTEGTLEVEWIEAYK